MKTQKFKLVIPEPCHEDWNKMTKEAQGRFCAACSTVVMDFSSMTDEQIIQYLQNRKGETCGRVRMRESQLNHEYIFVNKKSNPFQNVVFRYTVAGLLTFASLKGAAQSGVKQIPVSSVIKDNAGRKTPLSQVKNADHIAKAKTITVKVTNKFTGKTLPNAYIQIEGMEGFFKAENGSNFISVVIPDSMVNKTLNVYIYSSGFESEIRTVEFKANENHKDLNVTLDKYESMKMGKMIYVPDNDSNSNKKSCTK